MISQAIFYFGCFAAGIATKQLFHKIANQLFLDRINYIQDAEITSKCIPLTNENKSKVQKVLNSIFLKNWDISKKNYFLLSNNFIDSSISDEVQKAIHSSHTKTMTAFVKHFDDLYAQRESRISQIMYFSTVSPVVEEFIFRYVIQKVALQALLHYLSLHEDSSLYVRIAISSALFSAGHLVNGWNSSLQRHQLFNALFLGFTAGIAQEKQGILGAMLVHSGSNLTACFLD